MASCQRTGSEEPRFEDPRATSVLFDGYHSNRGTPLQGASRTRTGYRDTHGYKKFFADLAANGFETKISKSRIRSALLKRVQILFLGLVDDSHPAFEEEELRAIEAFVRGGGGLFVITDHSNCYHHAEIINPVLQRFGFYAAKATACDRGQPNTVSGNGWLWSTNVKNHAVTRGVGAISFQTGGGYVITGTVAQPLVLTSRHGWFDRWDPTKDDDGGYYGNWKQDPGEQGGALPLVVAATVGRGRVVAVGDQNMLGDAWLRYADNDRLGVNAALWLGKKTTTKQPRGPKKLRLWVLEEAGLHRAGRKGNWGYYSLYVHLARTNAVLVRAHRQVSLDPEDLLFIVADGVRSKNTQSQVLSFLERGGTVLWLEGLARGESSNFLYQGWPELKRGSSWLKNFRRNGTSHPDPDTTLKTIGEGLRGPLLAGGPLLDSEVWLYTQKPSQPLVWHQRAGKGGIVWIQPAQMFDNKYLGAVGKPDSNKPNVFEDLVFQLVDGLKRRYEARTGTYEL